MAGSTLDDLAGFAGVDINEPFEAGSDSPAVGDRGRPMRLTPCTTYSG